MDKNMNLIKGSLHYTAPGAASVERTAGVAVGVATTLMSERGILLDEAFEIVLGLLPSDYRFACIPEAWRDRVPDAVNAARACPECEERRVDKLILGKDDLEGYVWCGSCGYDFHIE